MAGWLAGWPPLPRSTFFQGKQSVSKLTGPRKKGNASSRAPLYTQIHTALKKLCPPKGRKMDLGVHFWVANLNKINFLAAGARTVRNASDWVRRGGHGRGHGRGHGHGHGRGLIFFNFLHVFTVSRKMTILVAQGSFPRNVRFSTGFIRVSASGAKRWGMVDFRQVLPGFWNALWVLLTEMAWRTFNLEHVLVRV